MTQKTYASEVNIKFTLMFYHECSQVWVLTKFSF